MTTPTPTLQTLLVDPNEAASHGGYPVACTAPAVRPGADRRFAGGTYTTNERDMLNDLKRLVNALRADLVALGLIKGSA